MNLAILLHYRCFLDRFRGSFYSQIKFPPFGLMCKVSKSKFGIMEGEIKFQEKQIGAFLNSSSLLELAVTDDVFGLQYKVETNGTRLDDVGLWYGRKNRCKTKMGLEKRTPLMIAAVYGSTNVVKYIIGSGKADVNKVSDSDGATALHCVAAGRSSSSVKTVKLLLEACADPNLTYANRNKPVDLIARGVFCSIAKNGFCWAN
ncbi:putative ankyrin repeat-containing domain-containing protein [Helianthus annuus]|nr:putative ankyrin repeat-containing domain-containing protein [Helianthus annuus]